MTLKVRLDEVLTPELLAQHQEHIRDFLLMEGLTPDPQALGASELPERQLKELLAELAEGIEE